MKVDDCEASFLRLQQRVQLSFRVNLFDRCHSWYNRGVQGVSR